MRITSSVTSLSWIPSEAISGLTKLPFETGVTHYDDPPPDTVDDLDGLRRADRFRFANEHRAWIDVEDGRIVGYGYDGGGRMGVTKVRMARREVTFAAFALPDLQAEPEVGDGWVRFVQTAGGRTGVPAPRRVSRAPFVQWDAPLVWTTLALTLHADGRTEHEVVGASSFPRNWIYDDGGRVVAKSGLMDFKQWYRQAFGKHSPWGDEDSPALVTAVESALERELSVTIMRGGTAPAIRKLAAGKELVTQGDPGDEIFLLLDGVLTVEVGGEPLAQIGPGAVLGERAVLEGGLRTSTLRAETACKVAVAAADQLDRAALAEISTGHRREDDPDR
ncbi:MAG TPA: cyclic nucleotide-binding domain-containing protein [Acidimicrobiales bacterium]|nr:cyclic nucleotide-binding domain-containing protein [Acidimicrobiales bacterium]